MKSHLVNSKPAVLLILLALLSVFLPGCSTPTHEVTLKTVSFPNVSLPTPAIKRQGTLGVLVKDTRAEKPTVGKLTGRIGANPILVVSGGLEPRLTEIVKDALERAGYTVAPGGTPALEADVLEFRVHANGWTQGAQETIRFQLRDKDGQVLWDHTVKGEDGGMDLVDSFAEKSMNVALTRLLTDAINEFASDAFYQSMQKAAGDK